MPIVFNNSDPFALFLAAQANHQSILQIFIASYGILFAILGIWGYFHIKSSAVNKAEETVKEVLPGLLVKIVKENSENYEALQRLASKYKIDQSSQETIPTADELIGSPDE